tara:strand:- start:635 stop:850 length:216 start_codon:yes stop_codon:yes gene_type:complete
MKPRLDDMLYSNSTPAPFQFDFGSEAPVQTTSITQDSNDFNLSAQTSWVKSYSISMSSYRQSALGIFDWVF